MAELLSFTGTCEARLDSANQGNTIPLLSAPEILSPYWGTLEKDYILACDLRLESLRAEINLLKSLAQAPFPNIFPEDSTSLKLEKKFEIERSYPYLGLEILKRSKSGNILKLSEIPLQNKGNILHTEMRIPYLGTGAVKLLGKEDEIFLKIRNHGFGGINSSNDYIQIEGDYSCIITGLSKPAQYILPAIEKKIDKSLLSTGIVFLDSGFVRIDNSGFLTSWSTSGENNARLALMSFVAESTNTRKIILRNGISSLANLTFDQITHLDISGVSTLLSEELNIELTRFSQLEYLHTRSVNRDQINWQILIEATSLVEINADYCSLSTESIDNLFIALDDRGLIDGIARAFGNSGPSAQGLAAKSNLQSKGWTVTHSN